MADPLQLLLRRVRRRMVLARVARHAVIAAGVATGLGAMGLLAVVEGELRAAWVPILSVVGGIVWVVTAALTRWPREMAVALHVDRELRLNELLSSAMMTSHADDSASQSIRAMANGVAANIRAADVPVGMPSPRVALAVGLAACVVASFGAIIDRPLTRDAIAEQNRSSADRPQLDTRPREGDSTNVTAPREAAAESVTSNVREPESADASSMQTRADATSPGASKASDRGSARGGTADRSSTPPLAFGGSDAATESIPSPQPSTTGTGSIESGVKPTGPASPAASGSGGERSKLTASAATIGGAGEVSASVSKGSSSIPANCRDIVRAYFDLRDEATTAEQDR